MIPRSSKLVTSTWINYLKNVRNIGMLCICMYEFGGGSVIQFHTEFWASGFSRHFLSSFCFPGISPNKWKAHRVGPAERTSDDLSLFV